MGTIPEVTLRTAHDVRHLRVCDQCKKIGDDRNMVIVSRKDLGKYNYHGRCFIKAHGRDELLALPSTQTDKLTLGDIGLRTMKILIDRKDKENMT